MQEEKKSMNKNASKEDKSADAVYSLALTSVEADCCRASSKLIPSSTLRGRNNPSSSHNGHQMWDVRTAFLGQSRRVLTRRKEHVQLLHPLRSTSMQVVPPAAV